MTCLSCRLDNGITDNDFTVLMNKLADSWSTQNTESSIECFTSDAVYYQPPDEQFYKGHQQLRPYFNALKKGTTMKFHNLWFDTDKQIGVGEFTFGNSESQTAVTGVTVVTIRDKKISAWREYFIEGPSDFEEFISTEGKEWKWHIGNYP